MGKGALQLDARQCWKHCSSSSSIRGLSSRNACHTSSAAGFSSRHAGLLAKHVRQFPSSLWPFLMESHAGGKHESTGPSMLSHFVAGDHTSSGSHAVSQHVKAIQLEQNAPGWSELELDLLLRPCQVLEAIQAPGNIRCEHREVCRTICATKRLLKRQPGSLIVIIEAGLLQQLACSAQSRANTPHGSS